MLLLPRHAGNERGRLRLVLDTGLVVTASAMVLWYVEVVPVVSAARVPGPALAAAIAYPVFDLMLIFGAAVVLIRGAARSTRRPVALLVCGLLLMYAGDAALGYQISQGGAGAGRPWQFACWLTGTTLIMLAAVEQCRHAVGHRPVSGGPRVRPVSQLPYLAMIADTPIRPRASIGIALSGPGELSAAQLLHHADIAMYRAKRAGAAGFEFYSVERALC